MKELSRSSEIIATKIDELRKRFARHLLFKGIIRTITLLVIFSFLILLFEGFTYFPGNVRKDIVFFYVIFGIIFLCLPLVLSILIRKNKTASFDDLRLAKLIAQKYDDIRDSLLNALQLQQMLICGERGFSSELVGNSLEKVARSIKDHSFRKIIPENKLRTAFRLLIAVSFILTLIVSTHSVFFISASERLLHPAKTFLPPEPFIIRSESGTFGVLGGDTAHVTFRCQGRFPPRIQLVLNFLDYQKNESLIPDSTGIATYSVGAVREDVIYEAFVQNRSPFKPWRRISSGIDTILVTNRPEIINVRFTFQFPDYTGLKERIQESNKTELEVLPGTKISLRIRSNRTLSLGELKFKNRGNQLLFVNRQECSGTFTAMKEDHFEIIIRDVTGVSNLDPVAYRVQILQDAYPAIALLSPTNDIDLTESMEIPVGVRISDDYGFSAVNIHYQLNKKYNPDEQKETDVSIPVVNKRMTLQELFFVWNVDDLGLSPEDEIEFRVDVLDNDVIIGPKKNSTKTVRARFPSLTDLFAEVNEQQDEIYSENDDILKQLENTKEILEKVSMELLKDQTVKWEQKSQLEQELKKIKSAGEKIAELSERLENMIQDAKENQLFSPETLEKYMKLQQAFQDIMTPELKDAMEKLQKALEEMDPQQIQAALKNFKTTQEQFSKELDRMLELFKRIRIEQSVQELTKRFEDLAKRQEQIDRELGKTAPGDEKKMSSLSDEESAVKKDEEIAEDLMKRTKADMADFPMMPNAEMEQLIAQMEDMNISEDLSESQKSLKKGDKTKSMKSSKSAKENLSRLSEMMHDFQTEFNKSEMDEVVGDFQKIIAKTLHLSQRQEKLGETIKNTPRQSDRLMDVAVDQQRLYQNLSQVVKEMIDLSNKTFGVTPNISKGFGQASSAMRESISQMEERNPISAARSADKATEALNNIAQSLISAMDDLQQSGSASGFENYLKQLQQMAGQQQGINSETQMLQLGTSASQQLAIQRLAARQQQVKKSLEQLQQEMNQSGGQKMGDLGGIAKDMDEVIKDLQNNQLLRKTLDRQQRILSRLLDAQKSLRTQGYKDERVSKSGEDVSRISPGQLPKTLGERRSLLQENLEKALNDGYSKENEDIIRRYFESLSKEEGK